MNIHYTKLWRLLGEKDISKADLAELTGLSSRIIAKLSKNETVTTDTLARVCSALRCDVGDIMECSDESELSLYGCYRCFGRVVENGEHTRKTVFTHRGVDYSVYMTKVTATRSTHIYCEDDGTIYREQLYMMGGISTPSIVRSVLVKPSRAPSEQVIVVIRGKPGVIIGLDEGIWVSARNGHLRSPRDVFVMSEAAFKLFDPQAL